MTDWQLDRMARALSAGDLGGVRDQLRSSIRRVPYHGLWAATANTKTHHAIAMGLLGQDLVRSCNQALGQYVTAEKLGASLKRAFREASLLAEHQGIHLDVLSQEYNMVFLRASRMPNGAQAEAIQRAFAERTAKHVRDFFHSMAEHYPDRVPAIDSVVSSIDFDKPLVNLGFCPGPGQTTEVPLERLARAAIGASAAAKLARLRPAGFAFAEASAVLEAIEAYFSLLETHAQHQGPHGPLILRNREGRALLNPAVLVAFRAKALAGREQELVARLVSLLNCLDWVQQSRFSELASLHRNALVGRSLMRQLSSKAPSVELARLKEFALGHVPYLGIAEENMRSSGTLFWIDMKKLSVRCHIIREQKAAELMMRSRAQGGCRLADVIDAMIAIDLRVQDAREVLPKAARVAEQAAWARGLSISLQSHFGGDDAALYLHVQGCALTREDADAVGAAIAERCEQVRVAYCALEREANIAESICKLDRTLSATKVD